MNARVATIVAPRRLALAALALVPLALCSCQNAQPKKDPYKGLTLGRENAPMPATPKIDPTQIGTHDDIVSIQCFWPPTPWMIDSSTRKITGFNVTVYFVSSETEAGTFVPGTVLCWLYGVDPGRGGELKRTPLFAWKMDEQTATAFRVRKKSVMGYYYGFILQLPPELDLRGRQIELVFGYERADGKVVRSAGRSYRLPGPTARPNQFTGAQP